MIRRILTSLLNIIVLEVQYFNITYPQKAALVGSFMFSSSFEHVPQQYHSATVYFSRIWCLLSETWADFVHTV